ncbi:hypothetical protein ACL7TT_07040 [Microbulbifer sp. 2304DJ12-6]|uniref:terminase small subunit-like protein n=1 Tax=Microbulbifer sp. 2304DJ12-6 TaxID=3233340 RepID=UPI0039AF74EC
MVHKGRVKKSRRIDNSEPDANTIRRPEFSYKKLSEECSRCGATVIPPEFEPNILDIICQDIMRGITLKRICENPKMPSYNTVTRWLNNDSGFMQRYLDAARVLVLMDADERV